MTTRWYTATDLAIEFGVDVRCIIRWWRKGLLPGSIGNGKNVRFIDPGPELRSKIAGCHLDFFRFITTSEVAEVLQIKVKTLKEWIRRDRVEGGLRVCAKEPHKGEHTLLFHRQEVRRFLRRVEKRKGNEDHSPIIVRWLKGWLATEQKQNDILDEMMKTVAQVPEPDRSRLAVELWEEFDRVSSLLEECKVKGSRNGSPGLSHF